MLVMIKTFFLHFHDFALVCRRDGDGTRDELFRERVKARFLGDVTKIVV